MCSVFGRLEGTLDVINTSELNSSRFHLWLQRTRRVIAVVFMFSVMFMFSRPYSPQGAGLIPSWMTPTFWFTVTFLILFIGKRMAIFFPRWVLMYLNILIFSFLNLTFLCHAMGSIRAWHKINLALYWIEW